jgi:hypothetical protein
MRFPQYSRLDTSRLDRSRPVVALTDQWRVYTQPIPGHEMLGTVSMAARGETYTFALARRERDGVLCAATDGVATPLNRQDKVAKALAAAQADDSA